MPSARRHARRLPPLVPFAAGRAGQTNPVRVFSCRTFGGPPQWRPNRVAKKGQKAFHRRQRSAEPAAELVKGDVRPSAILAQLSKGTMSQRVFSVVGGIILAAWLVVPVSPLVHPALAQSGNPNPASQQAPAGQNTAKESKEPQKIDEYAEAQHAITGPAGNPECVWLGRRVVNLLWRDDLDTAFRHLDLYDRFGCPSGHIQAAFRCLILHSNSIDPKVPDSLNSRVLACWINPSLQVMPGPAAAAPPAAAAAPATPR